MDAAPLNVGGKKQAGTCWPEDTGWFWVRFKEDPTPHSKYVWSRWEPIKLQASPMEDPAGKPYNLYLGRFPRIPLASLKQDMIEWRKMEEPG